MAEDRRASRYLPEGLVEGCRLKRDIPRDQVLTYADVELPEGRIADALRAEQYRHFRGESWLEEHLKQGAGRAPAAGGEEGGEGKGWPFFAGPWPGRGGVPSAGPTPTRPWGLIPLSFHILVFASTPAPTTKYF